MIGKKCGLTVLVLVNVQSIMPIVQYFSFMMFSGLTLLELLMLLSIHHPRSETTKYFSISKLRVNECTSGLTSTPKAESFCSCKRRKFIGQNKVKIYKL